MGHRIALQRLIAQEQRYFFFTVLPVKKQKRVIAGLEILIIYLTLIKIERETKRGITSFKGGEGWRGKI